MAFNIQNVTLRISAGRPDQFPADYLPQVAFSGRSNVGKSSLINTLIGRKSMARVSSIPGKTITINYYDIDKKLLLVDLLGYGYARRAADDRQRWSALTDAYFTQNPNIDLLRLVVQLVDLRVGATDDDMMMLDFLNQTGIPYVIVATKADKPNKTERQSSLAALNSNPKINAQKLIPFSSHSGEGKNELWGQILKAAMPQRM